MKVLVTGADGFVGRWLTAELEGAGHEVIPAPPQRELDLATATAEDVAGVVRTAAPDALVHLAAISFAPDADRDPDLAVAVNGRGTKTLLDGFADAGSAAPALVVSSSDVYGKPQSLPIDEHAPTLADRPYGRSKLAQEGAALESHIAGRPVVVVRAFNHLGPGQRESFAAPSFARRVLALKRGEVSEIAVGNVDVRRDFTDVRDVVHAYRLLLEALVRGEIHHEPPVVNVGSGRSVAVRDILAVLCRLADVPMLLREDPALVRPNEPPEIRADISRVHELVGWRPQIPLERSLADLLASLEA
ncbi:MAG TPA: GDP-mannose 4,6-dehydratase [Candidatus Limnocylindrales bacterium]